MVYIDIKMPKSCGDCPMKTLDEDIFGDYYFYCPLIQTAIRGKDKYKKRFRKCPLKEDHNGKK